MKTKNLFLTLALGLFTTFSFAQILNSQHDFSAWAVNGSGTEASLCDACHTPHQANTAAIGAPLWNHTLSTVLTYQNYTSTTFDATDGGDPSGTSLLCLSCHDGTTALDAYGTKTPTEIYITSGKVGNATVAGTTNNLSSEHPISFSYSSSVLAGETGLRPEGDIVAAGLLNSLGDTVECASCHDVHSQGAGTYALLKVSNLNSALCTTCHIK